MWGTIQGLRSVGHVTSVISGVSQLKCQTHGKDGASRLTVWCNGLDVTDTATVDRPQSVHILPSDSRYNNMGVGEEPAYLYGLDETNKIFFIVSMS